MAGCLPGGRGSHAAGDRIPLERRCMGSRRPRSSRLQHGKNTMIHQAVEELQPRVETPEDAGEFSLLSFQPAFRNAIRESLRRETAVQVRVEELCPPADGSYTLFCEQALSGCPLNMEISLLNGRQLYISLSWVLNEGSAMVAVRATDITEQNRNEEIVSFCRFRHPCLIPRKPDQETSPRTSPDFV